MKNPDRSELVRLADLRSANIARQKEWDAGNQLTLAYRGNELAGEVGEACNVIKKLERERLGIAGSRDTVTHLAEELADVVICADLIAMHEGIDLLGEAVPAKFNATSEKVGLNTRLCPAPPADAGMREALKLAHSTMESLRVALRDDPAVHDRKWIPHGIALNAAIRKADNALADAALTAPGATTKSDGGGCEMCFGTGQHEGRFSINGPLCSYCGGSGKKSDVEALAATTAERPGTVTSEPEPSTSDPSSTRSEVAVEGLSSWCHLKGFSPSCDIARALLDQFEMIRRK